MESSRRSFIKIAGCSLLGIGGAAAVRTIARGESVDPLRGASPEPGALVAKRWAMVVDTKKCLEMEGCRDCILACHRAHNVPNLGNSKDEVKWIWKESYEGAFPSEAHEYAEESLKGRSVLVFCNHCDNPPCVRVCPTKATFKRKDGIVMMDEHRCIGCRYCVVACPYGSRSFNWKDPRPFIQEITPSFPTRTRGVVEKCNFCVERLAKGLVPACVESCKEKKALVFGDLEEADSEVRTLLRSNFTIRRKAWLGTQPELYYIV